ncbi:bifunctional diaminohydroxyphosphoribosylaminopyrimidine deaminase/5-amino-6-(5-phosphoribosylamino)uracil reductase RibD [Pasteurellaceae bacterium HPA106]|uniref:bifunctional diaminohydroxyphosphoribosylaminopyrimidine deaminase/5-amino-6-(5-phosphoribosylamino)uracil reductase RibD n=1 Tax=Spirabiliibacterium pneumoniae TaxID=221400 RepID=UPI001AAD7CFE|nr:bifunctional diaminohydroxyphosphoribosylaminopyrimidine deaminase/5-amino-6-(5-phosphoribosylamino)uracil reductase RibD [Spirabiliibacterium pneumoniae]MBE2896218.1 bifunctional diaminohydroxyphosphoribosylaminopyrimidine deaminase/5-amino-6-(5-phosphoribosylamino)uracil reductase RibD [Spirabiliibacterium pneumoniae]
MTAAEFDRKAMQRAIDLAWLGQFTTSPNPMVGCVIVKNGEIIGEGYHQKAGEAHAEVVALQDCARRCINPRGATIYVTLEPCAHTGRTPPCVDRILAANVARVVIALEDPNPKVAGKSIQRLRDAGIQVDVGLLAEQAEVQNKGFLKRMRTGRPYVQLKMAMTIDGKTATASGESKWITNAQSRQDVQTHRASACAILSASGTVLVDNPSLTVRWAELPNATQARYAEGMLRQPIRIIMDSKHRIRPNLQLFDAQSAVWLVGSDSLERDLSAFPAFCSALQLPSNKPQLLELMRVLGEKEINLLWVEAGANLAGSLISAGVVDELIVYIAPKLLGDQAQGLCHLPDVHTLAGAPHFTLCSSEIFGDDIKLTYRAKSEDTPC